MKIAGLILRGATRRAAWALAVAAALATACEGVDHDSIRKWESTEKGPGKLRAALAGDHDPALRAHAGAVLIQLGETEEVERAFAAMAEGDRDRVMPALIDYLWKEARLEGEMARPGPRAIRAKDALFELREVAGEEDRGRIDALLIEWLTSGYYAGRAQVGRVSGRAIVRAVGGGAGPALVERAHAVIARPQDPDGSWPKLEDELLIALAVSGHGDALDLLIDLIEKESKDPSLPQRAMNGLHAAFVAPQGIEPVAGDALRPVAGRIEAVAKSESLGRRMTNDAAELLSAMGGPECLRAFVSMVAYPHAKEAFRYIGTQRGIRCGRVEGIIPVVEALPATGRYERAILDRYLWREILALPAREAVAERARTLLGSASPVARVTGVEILGRLALPAGAAADAERVAGLAQDRSRLKGWYPAGERRRDPTVGQVASEVAKKLRKVASETESK
jgi:hypothetical protein